MNTWIVNKENMKWSAIIQAESVEIAIYILKKDLKDKGIEQVIRLEDLAPFVNPDHRYADHRYVRLFKEYPKVCLDIDQIKKNSSIFPGATETE